MGQITWVRQNGLGGVTPNSSGTHTFSLTAGATKGDVVVLFFAIFVGASVSAITDSQGNEWSIDAAIESADGEGTVAIASATMTNPLPPGGTVSVFTNDTSQVGSVYTLEEYSGISPVRRARTSGVNGGTTTGAALPVSTQSGVATGDLVVGAALLTNVQQNIYQWVTYPNGWGVFSNRGTYVEGAYTTATSNGPLTAQFGTSSPACYAVGALVAYEANAPSPMAMLI